MAKSKSSPKTVAQATEEIKQLVEVPDFVPKGKRAPVNDLTQAMVWLYGRPKVGKTTLAAQWPGAWFLATERGHDWLELYPPTEILGWESFLDFCASLSEHKPKVFGDGKPINTLVIDTVDILFQHCKSYICRGLGVEDPGELPHGKGWNRLNEEFQRVMVKVRNLGYGLVCISHSRDREVVRGGSSKLTTTEPDIGAGGMRVISAMSDLILYCYAEEVAERKDDGSLTGQIIEQRVMLCHPKKAVVAGGRMAERLPAIMTMNYDKLIEYFENTKTV